MTLSVQVSPAACPVLFVDASLQGVQIALIDASGVGRVLWQGAHSENKGALEQVSRLVAAGLAAVGMVASDLVGLAVGVGPGSFTGIKVALAFVYGLRSGLDPTLPLLGVSSLEAAARALAVGCGGDILVALPATKTHGFIASSGPSGHQAARLIDGEAPQPLGRAVGGRQIYITGAWPLLAAVATAAGEAAKEWTVAQLAAAALPELVREISAAWPHGFARELPAPRYLRLSTAEERLLAEASALGPQQKDLL